MQRGEKSYVMRNAAEEEEEFPAFSKINQQNKKINFSLLPPPPPLPPPMSANPPLPPKNVRSSLARFMTPPPQAFQGSHLDDLLDASSSSGGGSQPRYVHVSFQVAYQSELGESIYAVVLRPGPRCPFIRCDLK